MPKVNDNIFTTSSLRFEKQKLVLSSLSFNLVWWHIFLFPHKLQESSSAKLKCRPFFYEFTCCVEGLALKISQFHNLFYYCLAISSQLLDSEIGTLRSGTRRLLERGG